MSAFNDLNRFLVANGVNRTYAFKASSLLRAKVTKRLPLDGKEAALLSDFAARSPIRSAAERAQISNALHQSRTRSRGNAYSTLADKSSADRIRGSSLLADKSSADRVRGPSLLADKALRSLNNGALRPADVRQLAMSISGR